MAATSRLRNGARHIKHIPQRLAQIYLGRDVAVLNRLKRQGRVTFGAWSYGVPTIYHFIHDTTALRVGSYTALGGTIMLGGEHAADRVTTFPHRIWMGMEGAGEDGFPVPTGDTIIGSDVWFCYGAMLLSGVNIGDGAIVAGGAVVVKDVPPFAIVGGNPAKLIRYRFNEEQIAALMEIKWWDWPEDEVRKAVPLLSGPDVDAFIEYARQRFPDGVHDAPATNGRATQALAKAQASKLSPGEGV